ncbi:ATP-dependent RNA helicase CHL1, partial [Dufourea novaeangliae]
MQSNEEFPFPFPPYPIQNQFMKELYKCLENANLGIFESPTGTGKSMSIICGAVKWLIDHEELQKNLLNSEIAELDEKIKKYSNTSDDWVFVQTEQMQLNTKRQALQTKLNTKSIEEELLLEDIIETSDNSEGEEEEEEIYENTKIFFCSRTHSQLSQFIGELKKSPYSKLVSVITLASRQNYCINTNIRRLKHLNLMNEHCLQLQKKKTTTKEEKDLKRKKIGTSCPFMPGDQDLLIGETLTQIQDVEEIAQKGENIKTCAYYASRKAIPHGQLILVPYNSILHKNTRNSSEIKLKGNILIIDEAHNLLDAIERMHSVMVTALFSAKSVLYLSQLSFYLRKLLTIFGATSKSNPNDDLTIEVAPKLYKLEEFEVMTEIDTVNVFELLKFIKNSRLSHKLQGFMEQYGNQVKIHKSSTKTSVRDARSIILAGGTMEPMDEFTEQLFIAAGAAPERIITFSCNHVVPQENIACSIVSRGPTGIEFEFNFKNQQNTNLLNELGRALVNICNIVPAGIVVFLPSYNFEELMYKHFDKSGVITKISSKKCIFRETKSASQVNEILEQYALCVKKPKSPKNGSLLFSVVGGKLSEGLNFSDDLGRCVIVVGMPYPNITSLELQEKMKYLNENIKPNAGQNFYENACMKAVNQCIGRAIRHINDYSTVLLFDKRYSKKIKTLPQWIQSTVTVHETFGTMIGSLAKFFIKKR